MTAIINERQLTPSQEEEIELRESHPEKFEEPTYDPYVDFKKNKQAADPEKYNGYSTYTREQTAALLAASKAPPKQAETMERVQYPPMPREECERLVREHYEYIEEQKRKRQERELWDSQKTTELEPKIKPLTKRINSSKT